MKKKRSLLVEIITILIPAIIIYIVLSLTVFARGTIVGNSMHGTYENGYQCLTFYYDKNNIQRFDTIAFYEDSDKILIKRVIGLPNERIEYRNNQLFINGVYTPEPFLLDGVSTEPFNCTLKEDEYFCMGDNRNNSNDSRLFGPIKRNVVVGTHLFVFFPFDKVGFYK